MPVPFTHIEVEFEGRVWPLDWPRITVRESGAIKAHTGHGLKSWYAALEDLDPDAVQSLYWLCKARNGEKCNIASLDFDVLDFMTAFGEAVEAAGDPVDPTNGPPVSVESPSIGEPTVI